MTRIYLLILLAISATHQTWGQDGSLDTRFGLDGKSINRSVGYDKSSDMVVQPDGKIVVCGEVDGSSQNANAAIVRFKKNGEIDSSFGTAGNAILDLSPFDRFIKIALQSDGKIVVLGYFYSNNNYIGYVTRFNADGSHDTTFNQGFGKYVIDFKDAIVRALTVLPDDKIFIGGNVPEPQAKASIFISRLNADGSFDPTFGDAGTRILNIEGGGVEEQVESITILADGKIMLTGTITGAAYLDIQLVARLQQDGSLDTSFNSSGFAHPFETSSTGLSFTRQNDGKYIVAGGIGENYPAKDLLIARYNPDGSLDGTFAQSGFLRYPTGYNGEVRSLAIDQQNKIIFAGSIQPINGAASYIFVGRLLENGRFDSSFLDTGIGLYQHKSNGTSFAGMKLASSDRIVVAGDYFENFDLEIGVMRLVNRCRPLDNTITNSAGQLTALETEVEYQWLDCDNAMKTVQGATKQIFIPTSSGNYSVELSEGVCIDTTPCVSIILTEVASLSKNQTFQIYPNPASNLIYIQSDVKIESLQLFNSEGKMLNVFKHHNGSLDISNLPAGVYYIKISSTDGLSAFRSFICTR